MSDLRPQAWIFWVAVLALALQVVATSTQSTYWLYNQPPGAPYFFLTTLSAIWSIQQFINILLYPLLNLRKFNGWTKNTSHMSNTPYLFHMLRSRLVHLAIMARSSIRCVVASVVCSLLVPNGAKSARRIDYLHLSFFLLIFCGRFLGNWIYIIYAYFSVSAYISCIPANYPSNFTALARDISACVAPNEGTNQGAKHPVTSALLQCVRFVAFPNLLIQKLSQSVLDIAGLPHQDFSLYEQKRSCLRSKCRQSFSRRCLCVCVFCRHE